jgi:aminoglycoside phosphotransferase (APT) family kinase protein
VPLSVAADAARAAVAAAIPLGVACPEPAVLADGANVIVHLRPSPVVAKVAASTPVVRADPGAWLQRELDLALFLMRAGAPVMAPSPEIPATVYHRDGHVMTFWTYLRPAGTGLPDEGTIGSMLRDLHAVLRTDPGAPPVLAPLGDIPAFLARPQTLLSAADVCLLTETYTRLTGDLTPTAAPRQVLHGDAGIGNLMAADGQWVWHDFEDTCSGPAAWDLAATTASPRLDRSRVLAAYGDPVDPVQLRTCEQLRRLHLTIWYALYAERLPECRQRAAELLATWRTSSP